MQQKLRCIRAGLSQLSFSSPNRNWPISWAWYTIWYTQRETSEREGEWERDLREFSSLKGLTSLQISGSTLFNVLQVTQFFSLTLEAPRKEKVNSQEIKVLLDKGKKKFFCFILDSSYSQSVSHLQISSVCFCSLKRHLINSLQSSLRLKGFDALLTSQHLLHSLW